MEKNRYIVGKKLSGKKIDSGMEYICSEKKIEIVLEN